MQERGTGGMEKGRGKKRRTQGRAHKVDKTEQKEAIASYAHEADFADQAVGWENNWTCMQLLVCFLLSMVIEQLCTASTTGLVSSILAITSKSPSRNKDARKARKGPGLPFGWTRIMHSPPGGHSR